MINKKRVTSSDSIFSILQMLIKQSFIINKTPLPWTRAFSAGLCSGLPVFIGFLIGNFQYGLLAGIGGFTYLYVFNIPYAQRAKKLFFVLLGLSFSVGLGTLFAPHPLASAIMVAVIGAIVTFIFGALKMTGPAAIFFVLVFLLSAGMPIDQNLAPVRAGLVFLGGAFSWIVGMIGWFANPHGPEKIAVKKVYQELAAFMDAVGTVHVNTSRQKLVVALKLAEDLLLAGFVPWRISKSYKQLFSLNKQANILFLDVLEHFDEKDTKLPPELETAIRTIAVSIDHNEKSYEWALPKPEDLDERCGRLFSKIDEVNSIANESLSNIDQEISISKPSLRIIFGGAFDKNSIVFLTAFKFGFVLFIAALIAYSFDFNRSYWVTLSCAAVLSGATIMATFQRAIQRSIGTLVGILIASVILYIQPEGYVIAIFIFIFTLLTELAIVLNYGLAALFITPNALLLAESTSHIHNISFFTSARLIDVLIGGSIGVIGALLMNRRSSSSLLPYIMAKTIRSQQQFLLTLFSKQTSTVYFRNSSERSKMQTNLINLKLVYSTALGEISRNKTRLDFLWPAIYSIEQLGYLLDSASKYTNRPTLSDADLSQLLVVFETMATAVEQERVLSKKPIPEIIGFSKIQKEIQHLQNTLQVIKVHV